MISVVLVMVIGVILIESVVVGVTVDDVQEDRHEVSVAETRDDDSGYPAPSHNMVESVRTNAVSHTAARIKSSLATQVNILRSATENTS